MSCVKASLAASTAIYGSIPRYIVNSNNNNDDDPACCKNTSLVKALSLLYLIILITKTRL